MIEEPPNPAHLKLKAATAVATVALAAGLLLFDWDAQTGHQTVFSSVRPTVKVLLTAIEDGDSLPELADSLADFVPHASRQALSDGLCELDAVVKCPAGSASQPDYAWMQPAEQEAQQQAAVGGQVANEPADAGIARQQQQQQQGAGGPSALSVAAAEFRPAAATLPTASMAALDRCGRTAASAAQQDEYADSWQHSQRLGGSGGDWQACASVWDASEAAEAAADAAAAHEKVAGGPAAEAAFLAVLGEQFPLFSAAALAQLFAEQGSSLAATIHTLCGLEAELEGQATAAAAVGTQQAAGPAFTADDFPSLGGPTAASSANSQARNAAGYASKARAAAELPGQPRSSGGPGARQRPAAAVAAGATERAAPIWQAQGVQQFATGAAAAQEYAELRAEARDHARLRNAYFQQATQAYLAGNKRLARELGAKGRWHGEQMHAAHAAAAAETFTRRNPGAAAAIVGSSGSGTRSGGVQTIDLHGLHVSEALQLLEGLLLQLQSGSGGGAGRARRLRVVVGAGTHGKVPARLPAAVRRYLQEQGLSFSEPYAGLLEVSLQ
ncbi:hypothetical protein COHA_002038 [Chlorella ohadii]|uniref:Smr domain-containing protein n=1 Tax=Chlorella ohadii TaxID=2649997 RepID=A0AAD5DXK1_9CHLO|nr:hypothetical protein COHA_002038 [Chlorella ohadii]